MCLQDTNPSLVRCLSVSTKIQSSNQTNLLTGDIRHVKLPIYENRRVRQVTGEIKITLQLQLFWEFLGLFLVCFGERQTPRRIRPHVKPKCNAKLITGTRGATSSLSLQPRVHGTASFTETTTCRNKTDILKSFHFSCRSEELTRKPGKACYQQFEGKNLGRNSSALLILLSPLARQAFVSYSPSFTNYSKGDQEFEVDLLTLLSTVPDIKGITERSRLI